MADILIDAYVFRHSGFDTDIQICQIFIFPRDIRQTLIHK